MNYIDLVPVLIAGAVGGTVNALMTDNGFIKPRTTENDGRTIIQPGFIGNVIIGAVAGAISWALAQPATGSTAADFKALAGAALVGVAGARWLTNEIDKRLLNAAVAEAASTSAQAGQEIARQLPGATPSQVLQIAQATRLKEGAQDLLQGAFASQ